MVWRRRSYLGPPMVYQAAVRDLKISDVLRTVLEKRKSSLSCNFFILSSVEPLVSTDTVFLARVHTKSPYLHYHAVVDAVIP